MEPSNGQTMAKQWPSNEVILLHWAILTMLVLFLSLLSLLLTCIHLVRGNVLAWSGAERHSAFVSGSSLRPPAAVANSVHLALILRLGRVWFCALPSLAIRAWRSPICIANFIVLPELPEPLESDELELLELEDWLTALWHWPVSGTRNTPTELFFQFQHLPNQNSRGHKTLHCHYTILTIPSYKVTQSRWKKKRIFQALVLALLPARIHKYDKNMIRTQLAIQTSPAWHDYHNTTWKHMIMSAMLRTIPVVPHKAAEVSKIGNL